MIAFRSNKLRAEDRRGSGVLLAMLELSAELDDQPGAAIVHEPTRALAQGRPDFDPSRSSALLESLHREWSDPGPDPAGRDAATGRRLGRYRLLDRLGRGSQAEVWRAIRADPALVMVALKVLPPALARDPVRRDRFRREAEMGARLASAALVPTFEFGEDDGLMFLAMPLIEGGSLGDVIAERRGQASSLARAAAGRWGALTDREYTRAVVHVMARVARALAMMHASGVAHRDIKPGNILLDRGGEDRAFLCDFGLVRELGAGAATKGDDGAGTPLYMAPERLLGRVADEVRCDIYSLGVTLYEAVTLVHPFPLPANIPLSCLAAYLVATTPPRPRDVCPALPAPLETIVRKAMEPDPAWRYRSVADLADDLERFLIGAPGRWLGPLRSRGPSPRLAAAAGRLVLDGFPRSPYNERRHLASRVAGSSLA